MLKNRFGALSLMTIIWEIMTIIPLQFMAVVGAVFVMEGKSNADLVDQLKPNLIAKEMGECTTTETLNLYIGVFR